MHLSLPQVLRQNDLTYHLEKRDCRHFVEHLFSIIAGSSRLTGTASGTATLESSSSCLTSGTPVSSPQFASSQPSSTKRASKPIQHAAAELCTAGSNRQKCASTSHQRSRNQSWRYHRSRLSEWQPFLKITDADRANSKSQLGFGSTSHISMACSALICSGASKELSDSGRLNLIPSALVRTLW
jgi:hypothetical protein